MAQHLFAWLSGMHATLKDRDLLVSSNKPITIDFHDAIEAGTACACIVYETELILWRGTRILGHRIGSFRRV